MAPDAKKHYSKPGKSFADQVKLLRGRGMHIEDHQLAREHLSRIGYYRLSGYWEHLLVVADGHRQEQFVPGASWDQVIAVYDFDNRLKTLVFEAIGAIEIAVRTQLTYHLYVGKGPFDYLNEQIFKPGREGMAEKLRERCEEELCNPHPHEDFIRHYQEHYVGTEMPILMLTECLYLHELAQFFDALKPERQHPVSRHFSVGADNLANWLICLNLVRNSCAHHSRLWNRKLKRASWPQAPQKPFPGCRTDRVFMILCIVARLIGATHFNSDSWRRHCHDLLASLEPEQLAAMGVEGDWEGPFQPPA